MRTLTAPQSRHLRWAAGAVGVVVLLYFMPLFHFVPLEATRQQSASAVFDPVTFVEDFWHGPLLEATRRAVDAAELLAALQRDFAGAATRFGHRLGLSATSSYLVSGQGRITAVDDDAVAITLGDDDSTDIVIDLGPVFGNSIRDGSGLLDVSDFANAQDFNALSAEINRRVEEQVLPYLKENSEVGMTVRFAGGVEVADSTGTPSSLVLTPVFIEFP